MNITQVLGNRVLVEPLPEATETDGGIYLPQRDRQKQAVGIVRMVGTGSDDNVKLRAQMAEIAVGATVRVDHSFGSIDVEHNGKLCRIHSVADVLDLE